MDLKKEFKKDHEMLDEIEGRLIEAREKYNEGRVDKKYKKVDIDVDALKREVDHLRAEEKEIREKYAKHIFDVFSASKPDLIQDTSGKRVDWKSAFGESFDKLDAGLKNSLVALIEEDGGQFRIA